MMMWKRHSGAAVWAGFFWELLFCASAWGVEFAGGTGEPNAPYQIATVEQLRAIGSSPDLFKKHYVLVASLDLSDLFLSEPAVSLFAGALDGKGYTIRNLQIRGEGFLGLFGSVEPDGEIRNLGIVDAQVTGSSQLGVLVSTNMGRVLNCYSTGTVSGTVYAAGGLIGNNQGIVADSYSTTAVTGSHNVGGLVGENSGTISSCYSTGAVTADRMGGGLVGWNLGVITDSHTVATVTGQQTRLGGLAGSNNGRIMASYAKVTVVGQDRMIGGLVGENVGGVIQDCYSSGSVTGQETVGGLVGHNAGQITAGYSEATVVSYGRYTGGLAADNAGGISSCYATGRVEGEDIVGGLVGDNRGWIYTSYASGAVLGYGWDAGGLAGRSASNAGVGENCYFLDPADGGGPDNWIGTPLTSSQMKVRTSFEGWDFWGNYADGVLDMWFMPEQAYPVLAWQTEITGLHPVPNVSGLPLDEARAALTAAGFTVGGITYDFDRSLPGGRVIYAAPYPLAPGGTAIGLIVSSGEKYDWAQNAGNGTAANPYQIQTAGQLESLTDHPELWSQHFVLAAEVDMTGRTYMAALIAPDMDNTTGGFQGVSFGGTLNGQGHAIRNLVIHSDTHHDYLGLFGMIGSGGRIEGLTLLEVDIAGGAGTKTYLGALAGYNAGTLTNCSATGVLRGGHGDGLVGSNSGKLIDCHADTTRL
jgi:hypothetical protein